MRAKEKHKEKEEGFMRIHNSYKDYKKKRFDVKNIYDLIKHEYTQKLENNELNFKLERVCIKMKMGWDADENTKIAISSISSLAVGIILAIITQDIKAGNDINLELGGFAISVLLLVAIHIFINRKNFIRDYNKKIYFKLCLDVLDELEKEKAEP